MTGAAEPDRVAEATNIVAAQVRCTLPEALQLMEERAEETGRTVEEIANEVVEREIRFDV
jgi:AmiR/NasT family two-component response regulator